MIAKLGPKLTQCELSEFGALWPLVKRSLMVTEIIAPAVGVVTNSFHAFWEPVIILERLGQLLESRESKAR
jgi:hypothetical protein